MDANGGHPVRFALQMQVPNHLRNSKFERKFDFSTIAPKAPILP